MNCDGSTTDDDSTEDEEDTKTADDNANSLISKTRCPDDIKLEGKCSETKCSESEVWCEGHSCLAPYSGDNEYYEAIINSIHDASSGHRQAVVTFIGYESEGSEVVPVTALRKSTTELQKNSTKKASGVDPLTTENSFFFSHLKGNEAEENMRLKYGEFDVGNATSQNESRHITDFSLVSAAPPLSCSSVSIIFFLPLVLIFCVASLSLCCCFLLWLFAVFALFSSFLLTRFSLPVPRDVPHV